MVDIISSTFKFSFKFNSHFLEVHFVDVNIDISSHKTQRYQLYQSLPKLGLFTDPINLKVT